MSDWSFIKSDSVVNRYVKSLHEVAASLKKEEEVSAQLLSIKEAKQYFRVRVPGGICSVAFVFLPGSSFDFDAFQFLF